MLRLASATADSFLGAKVSRADLGSCANERDNKGRQLKPTPSAQYGASTRRSAYGQYQTGPAWMQPHDRQ